VSPVISVVPSGRLPVPEWEAAARAVRPQRVPAGLAGFIGRHHVTVVVLSLAALALAAWLRLPWLGLASWLIGAGADWLGPGAGAASSRRLAAVGGGPQQRALLRSLVAAGLIAGLPAATAANAALTYLSAVLVIQLVWLLQPALAGWLFRVAPPLRYPAGAAASAPFGEHAAVYARGIGTRGVAVALEAAILLVSLLTAGREPDSLWVLFDYCFAVAIAETALIYLGWTTWQAMQLRRQAADAAITVLAELDALAPRFVIHLSALPASGADEAASWLSALEQAGVDAVIVVGQAVQLDQLPPTRIPVIYAPGPREREVLGVASLRAAVHVGLDETSVTLLRRPGLRQVLLDAGNADRPIEAGRLATAMGEVWLAGPAAVERYRDAGAALAEDQLRVVGRPQAAALMPGPTGNARPVLLYAPTLDDDGSQFSSLEVIGPDLIAALLERHPEADVWFRPPAGAADRAQQAVIAQLRARLGRAGSPHLVTTDRGLSVTDCLNAADVLITDISTLATDFLATGRPIITCDPLGRPQPDVIAAHPSLAGSYLVHPGVREVELVLGLAWGADPLRPVRERLRDQFLGAEPGTAQAVLEANLIRVTSD